MTEAPDGKFFICAGPPKSGTTMLQRTLNAHPEVSCPSEHALSELFRIIANDFMKYNNFLKVIDRRTGMQGADQVGSKTIAESCRYIARRIAQDAAGGKTFYGLNDNWVLDQLEQKLQVLGYPKLIVIFRHPLNRALSARRHNLRLAKIENNDDHIRIMEQHGGVDEWIDFCAHDFVKLARNTLQFAESREGVLTVRFEELVSNKKTELTRIFGFLGASTDAQVLDEICRMTEFETMRGSSGDPEFYHSAGKGYDAPDGALERVERIAGGEMRRLGYLPGDSGAV
jgi:hypothetical protein